MASRLPPGPTVGGWLGALPSFRHDPIRLLLDSVGEYGEVVHFRLLHRHVVVLANPEHVRHVFQDNYRNYDKRTPGFRVLRTFLRDGLLTNEGDAWLSQRRTIQPGFHRDRIASFAGTMTDATEALALEWEQRGAATVDLSADMARLTLRIVCATLLGAEVGGDAARVSDALSEALPLAIRSVTRVVELPQWIPTPSNRRLRCALDTLDEVVYAVIDARRTADDTGDLLSMLIRARDSETGAGMSDEQLRDEVMTIFLAGHETTALALGWTWYLLGDHPASVERLSGELADVLGGRSPRLDDLPRLEFTERVIKESMRLFPPAWIISRSAIGADRIADFDIPAGTIVFASPYVTHRLERLWSHPWSFDPDRFASPEARALPPFAYFPFGGGPRQCIGNQFAMMEMVLVLATLAQRFRFTPIAGERPGLFPAITLRPSNPIKMTCHPRTPDAAAAPRSAPARA